MNKLLKEALVQEAKPGARPDYRWWWWIHHGQILEMNDEPITHRVRFVREQKLRSERAIRLRWMVPVKFPGKLPEEIHLLGCVLRDILLGVMPAQNPLDRLITLALRRPENLRVVRRLHRQECPGCPLKRRRPGSPHQLAFPRRRRS